MDLSPEEELLLIEICEHGPSYTRPNKVLAGLARKRLVRWISRDQTGRGSWRYWYEPTDLGKAVYRLIR